MAFEGRRERVDTVVVDGANVDIGGKAVRARPTGQDGDLKASFEQAFEDCWAEITGGLNMDVSASLCTQQTEGYNEGPGYLHQREQLS